MSSTEEDLGVVSATEGDSQSELTPVEGGAGVMAPPAVPQPEGRRRRARKPLRQSSREGAGAAPLPQHRSWKNSRRPRNGHGRGLPKKGSPPIQPHGRSFGYVCVLTRNFVVVLVFCFCVRFRIRNENESQPKRHRETGTLRPQRTHISRLHEYVFESQNNPAFLNAQFDAHLIFFSQHNLDSQTPSLSNFNLFLYAESN